MVIQSFTEVKKPKFISKSTIWCPYLFSKNQRKNEESNKIANKTWRFLI